MLTRQVVGVLVQPTDQSDSPCIRVTHFSHRQSLLAPSFIQQRVVDVIDYFSQLLPHGLTCTFDLLRVLTLHTTDVVGDLRTKVFPRLSLLRPRQLLLLEPIVECSMAFLADGRYPAISQLHGVIPSIGLDHGMVLVANG